MKKRIYVLLIILSLFLNGCVAYYVPNDTVHLNESEQQVLPSNPTTPYDDIVLLDKEITFMDIPWGTTFKIVDEIHGELDLWGISGEGYKTFSVDDIALGEYKGIDFEYDDINVIGHCRNNEIEVAGYVTSDVNMYFLYTINENNFLNQEESDSILYGAQYIFEAKNLESMTTDLKQKITSVYGEPQKTTTDTDWMKNVSTYTYWYGQNDTLLVMKSFNTENGTSDLYEDEITLSYVWLKGDYYLQTASDWLKQKAIQEEESNYGNKNTDGL